MKSAKIFIIFTFLLAFAFQVSAQDEKPKIFWKNLQEKYERFEDIKPIIRNLHNKPIYLDNGYFSVSIMFFAEERNNWVNTVKFLCGTGSSGKKIKPYTLLSQNEFEIPTDTTFWLLRVNYITLESFESYREEEMGRFKLVLYYGTKNSLPYSQKSFSPEFQVKIPKS